MTGLTAEWRDILPQRRRCLTGSGAGNSGGAPSDARGPAPCAETGPNGLSGRVLCLGLLLGLLGQAHNRQVRVNAAFMIQKVGINPFADGGIPPHLGHRQIFEQYLQNPDDPIS